MRARERSAFASTAISTSKGDGAFGIALVLCRHMSASEAALIWDLHPGYVLQPQDRGVLDATRQGLPDLLPRYRRAHSSGPETGKLLSGPLRDAASAVL